MEHGQLIRSDDNNTDASGKKSSETLIGLWNREFLCSISAFGGGMPPKIGPG